MKFTLLSAVVSAVCVASAEKLQTDDDVVVSLLQHSARPIHKVDGSAEGAVADIPVDQAERIRARRARKRLAGDADITPERLAARKARRLAKRQTRREAHIANQRHFGDGGPCDTCLQECEELFQTTFRGCMISEECQPWEKEDGATSDKCKKRCDRVANWKREPCNRLCECDNPVPAPALVETQKEVWADAIHRCRVAERGMISDCPTVAAEATSFAFDSIKKCAKASVAAGADTFNFFRTSKQFGRCTLKNCGSGDLKLINAPADPEATPAGRGNWKVFSTYCPAPPVAERSNTGQDDTSR